MISHRALLYVVLGLITIRLDAQVPPKVLNAFSPRYTNVENLKWEADKEVHVVPITHLEQSKTTYNNKDGTRIKTNIFVDLEDLKLYI